MGVNPTISTCNKSQKPISKSQTKLIIKQKNISKFFRKNQQIRVPEVRLISDTGEQLGIVPTSEAMQKAQDDGLDLVEVNPTVSPPVCKIVDSGKMLYEQEKKERKQKAKQKKVEIKGIRLSVGIAENDLMIRVKQTEKFLGKRDKVQILVQLRGREKAHPEKAYDIIEKFLTLINRDKINLEVPIKRQGGRFTCLIAPK